MKVLFVTSVPLEYSSSANVRNIALLKGLDGLGFEIDTLSSFPDKKSLYYDDSLEHFFFKKRFYLQSDSLQKIFSTKRPGKFGSFYNNIKKKLYYFYTTINLYDSRKNLSKRIPDLDYLGSYDLIISSSDPKSSHLLVEELINKKKVDYTTWIQYWGDPFLIDININTKLPKFLIKKEEKRLISLADKVIYVSPFTLKKQKDIYKEYDYKLDFLPIPYIEKKYKYTGGLNDYIVGYFGDYYSRDRNILPLINSIPDLNIKLRIFGYSNINLKENNSIKVNGRISYEKVKEEQLKVNLLVCLCNLNGTQIPGKLYHYAATDIPILVILDGENKFGISEYLEKFDRFEFCDNNVDSIQKKIRYIMKSKKKYEPSYYLSPENIAKQLVSKI